MTSIQLDHVVLEVKDVGRSLEFYCKILGAVPVRWQEFLNGEAPFASARTGVTLIDLFPSENPAAGPNHLCIEVAQSVHDIMTELASYGYHPDPPEKRFGAKGQGLSVYIEDPDGHRVEVRTYSDPRL
ncbi:MAG: VOC family protein [Firmicutes bacterium]|nr:VOC family protein [Bacillota bacterium]